MNPLLQEIVNRFKKGSVYTRLIYINLTLFLVYHLLGLFLFLFQIEGITDRIVDFMGVSAYLPDLLIRPYGVLTYMFFHVDFFHIFFNMITLYFSSILFIQFLDAKKLLVLYILGGISGALLFIATYNIFPVFNVNPGSIAIGASASVLAILIAVAVYRPDFEVSLLLLARVKLKYIALFIVVIDLISIPKGNAGGHIAHLGGALYGYVFIILLRKGYQPGIFIFKILDGIAGWFKPKRKMKITYQRPKSDFEYNQEKVTNQKEVDRILDKIAKGGYDSLTREEKSFLFQQKN